MCMGWKGGRGYGGGGGGGEFREFDPLRTKVL